MAEIRIGQIWREVDPRFERKIRVVDIISSRTIKIESLHSGRKTTAHPARFNGKRGGYEFLMDSAPTTQGDKG